MNDVATKVLNGEMDIDQARTYASLARVVSQTFSAQVTRARFLKERPDLDFTDEVAIDVSPPEAKEDGEQPAP